VTPSLLSHLDHCHHRHHFKLKRTQRNLFIIMSSAIVFYSIMTRLPYPAPLWIVGALLAAGGVLVVWGRDFFVARRLSRRQRWREAATSFERFEKKLLASYWPRLTLPLYLGIYTFDGVAIARNNIGQNLMNLEEFETAERWLRSALQRDPQYATPYVNLAIIAATRGDKQIAVREMNRAIHLGYSPVNAHRMVERALARAKSLGRQTQDDTHEH
jgi:tetratricopeptide (TPR) repeat protein